MIGDYMSHSDLLELEAERTEHFEKVQKFRESKTQAAKKENGGWFGNKAKKDEAKEEKSTAASKKDSEIDSDYVPVDFAAYTIRDSKQDLGISDFESAHLSDQLLESEKIWRISSLTASVDDDTKIMILPLPESKRLVKIADTVYNLKTYQDFFDLEKRAMSQLSDITETKRFEDKTGDEVLWENERKKKQ